MKEPKKDFFGFRSKWIGIDYQSGSLMNNVDMLMSMIKTICMDKIGWIMGT